MEKWDIMDKNGNITGRTVTRGNVVLRQGDYHLVVHIWVLSADGNFLIQRRAATKRLMPDEWAATGGAAIAGEDSYTAAARELYEELSITSNRNSLRFMGRIKRRNSFIDIWVIKAKVTVGSLSLQPEEVAAVKWVSKKELIYMIKQKRFHNYGNEDFDTVFNACEQYLKEEREFKDKENANHQR